MSYCQDRQDRSVSLNQFGSQIVRCTESVVSCDALWESAYERFETPEQEIEKFLERIRAMRLNRLPLDSAIVEIFCGRGNGINAFNRLGFECCEGVDLSLGLLEKFDGKPTTLYLADCRELPFEPNSKDLLIVQGGMHHLPTLPDDVNRTVDEVLRVLRPGGRFAIVEPYPTMALKWIHRIIKLPPFRKLSPRCDALEVMTQQEYQTYYNWMRHAPALRTWIANSFEVELNKVSWTKWMFVGRKT